MSEAEDTKQKAPGTEAGTESDHSANIRLMREMGSKKGYNPIPPDQHGWQLNSGTPLHELWSWICSKILALGHRCPYACDRARNPLFIEDAAAALKWDTANARRTWKQGVEMGIWRNGEGAQARYLFLCGEVPIAANRDRRDGSKGQAKRKRRKVCTDLSLPYMARQINKLEKSEREALFGEYQKIEAFEDRLTADAKAAIRLIVDTKKDKALAAYGIEKRRTHPEKKKANATKRAGGEENLEARQRQIQLILALFEKLVQTMEGDPVPRSEQNGKTASYKDSGEAVQTTHLLIQSSSSEFISETTPSSSSLPRDAPVMNGRTQETTTNARPSCRPSPKDLVPPSSPVTESFESRLNRICDEFTRFSCTPRQLAEIRSAAREHADTWLDDLLNPPGDPTKNRYKPPRITAIETPAGLRTDAQTFANRADRNRERDAEQAAETARRRCECEAQQRAQDEETARAILATPEDDPYWTADDRARARGILAEQAKGAGGG